MGELLLTSDPDNERVLLVGVQLRRQQEWLVHDSLDELALLSETAGADVADRVICK